MKKLFAAFCLALVTACSAQNITMRQVTNYAVFKTNGQVWKGLTFTNDSGGLRFTNAIPEGYNLFEFTSIGDNSTNPVANYSWDFFQTKNLMGWDSGVSGPLLYFLDNGKTYFYGSDVYIQNNLRVLGLAYDLNNQRYVTTINSSNDVRVVAGAGTLVTTVGSGGVTTYTVTSTAGAGSTNAISAVTTNGGIGGIGLTSLAVNNGYGNTVAGGSNNGAFTLTWTVDFLPATNYANAIGLAVSNLAYVIGANGTNFTYQIGANGTSYVNAATVNITNALLSKQDGFAALTELGNSGIRFPSTSMIESNVNQILWNFTPTVLFTNSASSNLVVNVRTNKYYITATNNLTVTNFTGIQSGVASDTTIIIEPQLISRGIKYPTLGAASFGIYANTNANSPMWTTLTNGVRYALTISAFGTNTFWSISAWK